VTIRRFHIGSVMALVALAALNFGALRAASGFGGALKALLPTGVLPMANILVVGLVIGRRYPGSRRFLLGFETFGVMALACFITAATLFPDELALRYLHLGLKPYMSTFGPNLTEASIGRHPSIVLGFFVISVVMLGLPQLAVALIGGVLSRQFAIAEWPLRPRPLRTYS
jgi:hypothetical protein